MRPLSSTPLARYTFPRARIFAALLAEPGRPWTVAELASRVPEASNEAARTTLYLLHADRLVRQLPGNRRMTFQLTAEGSAVLRQVVDQWRPADSATS